MDETDNLKAHRFGLIFGDIILVGIIIAIILTRPTDEGMYNQLKSGDLEDKKDAIVYFVESGDDFAITALFEALQDQDVFVRVAAAEMLGDLITKVRLHCWQMLYTMTKQHGCAMPQ